jgi:toxin HigB-1
MCPSFRLSRRTKGWGFRAHLPLYVQRVALYTGWVIQSFRDAATQRLFETRASRRWAAIAAVALRKLDQMEAARALIDLRVPPGNRLEALKGDRVGQHSIRINDQYRVCFIWKDDGAHEVEIADYH